jgi:hypothetical protein
MRVVGQDAAGFHGLAGRTSILSSASAVGASRPGSGAGRQVRDIGSFFFQREWPGPRTEDAEGGRLARDEIRL